MPRDRVKPQERRLTDSTGRPLDKGVVSLEEADVQAHRWCDYFQGDGRAGARALYGSPRREPGSEPPGCQGPFCHTVERAPRPAHVARLENRPFRHGPSDAAPTIVRIIASAARTRRVKAEPAAHTEPELSTGDIGRRAASGVVLLTGKGIFGQALGLLSTIVVTRLLLPSQLGLFAIAVTISSFLWMLSGGLGMASALIRRLTAREHADLRAYVALQLGVTSILVVAVALATLPFGLVGRAPRP